MIQVDWRRLLSISPEELTEEDKDDLFDSVASFTPGPDVGIERIVLLLRVTQEILKYKGEQVESLVLELEDLASRQGREEAQKQQLLEEVDYLKALLSRRSPVDEQSLKSSEADEIRQELARYERQCEQLISESKAQEREMIADKKQLEKLSRQVEVLEREKQELQQEVDTLHEEASNPRSPELARDRQQELVDTIKQKNKHISQLLSDLETVEAENSLLREKLSTLRDELAEATQHITQLTGEKTSLKITCSEQEEKLKCREDQNVALRNQVAELVQQKALRDSQLDDFTEALDSRVQEWKKVLEKKDAETEELQSRLTHLVAQAPSIQIDTERSRVALLTQTLQRREDQVEDLQKQLAQATKELNESAAIIEQFKAQRTKRNVTAFVDATTVSKLKKQLQEAEDRIEFLEGKLKDAEEDAELKAAEATEMLVQLREYESGEYGLMEAMSEIKELRKQCRVRDKQIEELVQAANKMETEAGQLEEQNMALREKLGLPPEEPVSLDRVFARRKKEQALMRVLQQQAERLEEEKLHLRLENRRLMQQLNDLIQQLKRAQFKSEDDEAERSLVPVKTEDMPSTPELELRVEAALQPVQSLESACIKMEELHLLEAEHQRLEERLDNITHENESLRKGMHEILDSIHSQDASSNVQVESQCLERLLEALDSRHVSGWYHPAMRLQAQVHSLEGSCSVLREQLRTTRLEETKCKEELQRAMLKVEQMEQSLVAMQEGQKSVKGVVYEEILLPTNMSLSSTEVISKLNIHLLHVLDDYHKQEEKNKNLEMNLEDLNKNFNIVRHQMGLLYKQYGNDKSEWETLQKELTEKREDLEDNVARLESQVKEYRRHFEALGFGSDEQKRFLANSALQLAELKAGEVVSSRKCKALQNVENRVRQHNDKMREEILAMKCAVTKRIGDLQRHKEMSTYQITALQAKLEESVPMAALEAANKQLNDLTAKYRDILQKGYISQCDSVMLAQFEGEMESLRKDKDKLRAELLNAKERLNALEVLVVSFDQDTVSQDIHDNQISLLAKKLAEIELKELHEKQRADHAEKMHELVKGQLTQLEDKVSELEACNSTLQEHNQELQRIERELRDRVLSSVSREELQEARERLQELEGCKVELQLEKERLQEVGDIAQEQVRSLELWKMSQDYELESLRQQVLELQATGNEKSSLARLSHELLTSQLNEASLNKKVQQLQTELSKLQAYSLRQEGLVEEKERALGQLRNQLNARCRVLHQMVQELRQQYSGAVPLASQEHISLSLLRLMEERRVFAGQLCEAHRTAYGAVVKRDQLELEIKSMKELKSALEEAALQTQGQKQLVEWHNRNTELRLRELKSRRKAEFLETRCKHAEEQVQRQEEHIAAMEEERIKLEKDWEQAQLDWENTQAELYKQLSEYENQYKVIKATNHQPKIVISDQEKSSSDVNIAEQLKQALGLVSSHSQSMLRLEGELAQAKTKVSVLSQLVQEKEAVILTKSKMLEELRAHISATKLVTTTPLSIQSLVTDKEPIETQDKLALKATVESLQKLLTQKEETIARYQQLLKEGRDEHSKIASKLQQELQGMQAALSAQHQSYTRLKNRTNQSNGIDTKDVSGVIEKYVNQLQEKEDEVAVLQTTVTNLSNQLRAAREEVDRWRGLAGDRLDNMGELRQRLEDQHRTELQRYRDEAQHYRVELETAKQDVKILEEQLKQQVETSHKGPSAVMQSCVGMLRAQLQEKEAQIDILSKRVVSLQNEIKGMAEAATVASLSSPAQSGSRPSTKNSTDSHRSVHERKLASELSMAKAEIHTLQEQLQQRSHRAQRRDTSQDNRVTAREAQLHKKIAELEERLVDMRRELEKVNPEAESRRLKAAEEVARWDERKKSQQTIEKLRQKLKDKGSEVERIQKMNSALRDTVTRLEREKNILHAKLRSGKDSTALEARLQSLELDKARLEGEVSSLKARLEMTQHHAGGLGAAMLEERLEAQQRRIAALELSKKCSASVTLETEKLLEKLHSLQRSKLHLENENAKLRRLTFFKEISSSNEGSETLTRIEEEREIDGTSSLGDTGGGGDAGSETCATRPKSSQETASQTTLDLETDLQALKAEKTKLAEQLQAAQLQVSTLGMELDLANNHIKELEKARELCNGRTGN
ncbi:centrosomal protein of 290 kDa isoform X2 [Anabrus simplex]|uniref:centrosomal protein of 290 kDa isoform X2 n=1 Tax=Anabrus simplex TaxID=316456 RepID=UPI0035A29A1D